MSPLELCARLTAVGAVLSGLELLVSRKAFGRSGVFSLRAVELLTRCPALMAGADRALIGLLMAQSISGMLLAAAGPLSVVGRVSLAVCLVSMLVVRWRRQYGGDGAEQMELLTLLACAAAYLPWPSSARIEHATMFVGAQVGLAYFTAGVVKLLSPAWRAGSALPGIVSTHVHGSPLAAELLRKAPRLALVAGWIVIVFECSFPVAFIGPPWLSIAFITTAVAFHIACAFVMGLNGFLWSFPAALPCVWAIAERISWAR